ncbi:MAG: beta-lactamase family protein, partial [Alphaproteobacteria bacterium]|nr:beta-lactamase family protein [Alphaproteobacteria bacterium]
LGKALVATIVLQDVAAGLYGLDDPVVAQLPHWAPPASRFDWHAVTLRRILSHTAGLGLPDYPGFPPARALPDTRASLAGDTNGVGPLALEAEPGTGFAYSGGGFTLLQLMLEERHGQALHHLAARRLMTPLGMTRSSFDQASSLNAAAPLGLDAAGRPQPFFRFDAVAAAGLIATPVDLGRVLIALVTGDLLPGPLLEAMLRPHAKTGRVDGLWSQYGLGVEIEPLADGRRIIGHHGMNRGWRAVMAIDPATGDGLCAMANHDAAMAALDALVGACFA